MSAFLIICRSLQIKHSFKMWLNDNSWREIIVVSQKTTENQEKIKHYLEDFLDMIILNWKINWKINSKRTSSSQKAEILSKITYFSYYFQSQVFHLPIMFLSTGFNIFAKIMGGNYVYCCSSHISFNPLSHLK